jgi:hypothetical protein
LGNSNSSEADGRAIWKLSDGTTFKCLLSEQSMEIALGEKLQLVKIIRFQNYEKWLLENRCKEAPISDDYAIWIGDGESFICSLSSPSMELGIQEGCTLKKIVRNVSYNESMQIYYDTMNFGTYNPIY